MMMIILRAAQLQCHVMLTLLTGAQLSVLRDDVTTESSKATMSRDAYTTDRGTAFGSRDYDITERSAATISRDAYTTDRAHVMPTLLTGVT
jgi:hypothetical protein